MNNKELIAGIASKMSLPKTEVKYLLEAFSETVLTQLKEDNQVEFQSFGTFDVHIKEEQILVHPVTKVKTIIPPKLVVDFKQSQILKEKLNF